MFGHVLLALFLKLLQLETVEAILKVIDALLKVHKRFSIVLELGHIDYGVWLLLALLLVAACVVVLVWVAICIG